MRHSAVDRQQAAASPDCAPRPAGRPRCCGSWSRLLARPAPRRTGGSRSAAGIRSDCSKRGPTTASRSPGPPAGPRSHKRRQARRTRL